MLPEVLDCAATFGTVTESLFGAAIPILGVAGDQQAATIGQACFEPGMLKSTYGTGCFALLNTGGTLVASQHRLLGTIAYQLDGRPTYALEGSIFIAGAVVQWLRDGMQILSDAAQSGDMAAGCGPRADAFIWCRHSRASAPRTGMRIVGGRCLGWCAILAVMSLPRPRCKASAIRPAICLEAMQADMGPVPRHRSARRWRDDRQRLDDAVPV